MHSHFPSRTTWSNRKIITVTGNNIFRQRCRSRRRRPCFRSLISLISIIGRIVFRFGRISVWRTGFGQNNRNSGPLRQFGLWAISFVMIWRKMEKIVNSEDVEWEKLLPTPGDFQSSFEPSVFEPEIFRSSV